MGEVELPSWLKTLPQAPEYHPTEAEFADPVAYILKIEEEAKQYGICKIIPPFTKASKKVVVNNLNRSLYMSTDALSSTVHGSCGALSRSMGGVTPGAELSKPKGLFLDAACADSSNKAKFATRRQQLGWNPKRARGVSHSQNHKLVWQSGESYSLEQFEQKAKMFSRSRLGTGKDVPPLTVESLFWRAAAEKPISIEYANDIPGSAFADPARLRKRKRSPEDAEQVNLDSIFVGGQSEDKTQEEETGDEFDPSETGKGRNGGPETGADNVGGAGSKLANSAWNMRSVARSQGSLLRFMPDEVPGVTSPMVYIGMLFSWFAWHVEDHELHSLNYLHMGASKTWYAVPGDAAPALEEAIRIHGYGGHLDPRAAFSLLGEKTTVMSPEVLVAAGVPCCRLVQNAGEFVVTFPRAYHLGFSHGFNCGEAANFATPGWLEVAKEAAARRAAMNYLPMLSHQQLLYLLTMSLPPRMPASYPSEPRSSRLKVRKKSVGEEMVKSTFLQDSVHNNVLLGILLDKGVSRCLLAKDAGHRSPMKAVPEVSKQKSPLPALDDLERALISELISQGGDNSQFPNHGASNGEEALGDHCQSQSPSSAPVPSAGLDAVYGGLSMGNFGEKLAFQSSDASTTPVKSATEEAPHGHNKKISLAIDWGTLPCAACGILCYATMAVVKPSEAAAVTFKPIYAAAGLGHCAFEAHEAGRIATYVPALSYPRSSTRPEVNDEQPGTSVELPNPTLRRPVADDVLSARYALSSGHGYSFHQLTTQPSEEVAGIRTMSPTMHCDSKSRHLGEPTSQTASKCLETEGKAGRGTALVNMEQNPSGKEYSTHCVSSEPELLYQEELGVRLCVSIDCAASLGPATLDAEAFRSGNLDNAVTYGDWKDSHRTMWPTHALPEPLAALSLCKTRDFRVISNGCEHPLEGLQQSRQSDKTSCVRIDDSLDATEIPVKHEWDEGVLVPKQQGFSSLQLLASTYDESSDLEEEDTDQPRKDCDVLTEDKISVDEAAEGCEVLAKPHGCVGDLLADVIGLSADVPWLSLVPATELTEIPPVISKTPLFSFAGLVEGPQSLKQVFISGGFSFTEDDDTADPASLGSSLTEERCGKQSSEVTSVDGDLNNQTSDVHCGDKGKVIDMQELYQRINSQALTVDSDDDEQLLIDFGLRRPREGCFQEPLDVECKADRTEGIASPQLLEAKIELQVCQDLNVTPDVPSYIGSAVDEPSCPEPSRMGTAAADTRLKQSDTCQATAKAVQTANVGRLMEGPAMESRMSMASMQDMVAGTQRKDLIPETVPHMSHERRLAESEACKSARPRVLCLEHAVEAQERLRSVGGANILIVCHSDFDDYEVRAKQLTQEFGFDHTWRNIPFVEGEDDEVRLVNTAVNVEDEDRRVNDWVMQMGLFVHRFKARDSESSDDDQNPSEDFRAGPFSTVNQGKPSRNRLMAGRLGLSRKSDGYRKSGIGAQITVRYSRRLPKMSKKKKCTVAGKWCGKVWRVNQVHPFLGGCRTVDPSLQLGMPSTSLYALSMMSECDGGRYRKGISASKMEISPTCHVISDKTADDQQSIALRNRGRKRKALEQGLRFQQDNVTDSPRKMAVVPKSSPKTTHALSTTGLEGGECSSSPKHKLLAESRDGSDCLDGAVNGGEEVFTAAECQGQMMIQISPSVENQSDADLAVQSSKSDVTSPHGTQMLSPTPLATRNPSETEELISGTNGESIGKDSGAIEEQSQAVVLVGENECNGSMDIMKIVTPPPMSSPSDSRPLTDGNAVEFHLSPSPLPLRSIQTETGRFVEDVDDWHKMSSLSNVYSALPLAGRAVKGRNESNSSLVTKSTPTDGNKICGTGSAESCVWRDVPVVCAPSFHSLATPLTGEFTRQFPLPLPNSIHSQLYIPNVSVTTKETMSDHTLVSQNSLTSELYSGSSKTFGSCDQGGGKLQDVHLQQIQNVGHIQGNAVDAHLDSRPKESPQSPPGTPLVYTEIDTSGQHVGPSKSVGINGQQFPQMKPGYFREEALSSVQAVVPSLLDRAMGNYLGPNEEDCLGGSRDAPEGISEQLVCVSGGLQQSLQDIKNVVRLPVGGEKFSTNPAEGFASTSHLCVQHTNVVGQSTSNDSDPVHLQDAHGRNSHLYDSKLSIELTPVLSISPSLIGEDALVGSGELGFSDPMGQGSAVDHPLENLLPVRTSSRGRSAVKARGKRPKHSGWTSSKPVQGGTRREASVNNWVQDTHSHLSSPVIFTLQPKECVEARFEVEDCERVLEIPDQSTSPTGPGPEMGLAHATVDEDENDQENSEPEKVVAKAKKKAKPKKKRVPVGKPTVDDGDFHCDIDGCRMSFPTDSDLQIHKRNRCTFKGCGKRFFMHKYLLQHRRVHLDERPLKCPWKGCKQAFKWAWARTEHIRVHTGERPYACPDCDQTFRFVSDFSRHKRNTGHTKS